ncbi:hypothetical protein E2C01_065415 [Portunus trituberculatus]|uniref:Uncharacterized protein n=1 Tax=Portunus trituberculatus TaxID=210409 RepID=A0A5B7HRN9_PORTR|nr:hypothetical protein [Portunus trituberculatus]
MIPASLTAGHVFASLTEAVTFIFFPLPYFQLLLIITSTSTSSSPLGLLAFSAALRGVSLAIVCASCSVTLDGVTRLASLMHSFPTPLRSP